MCLYTTRSYALCGNAHHQMKIKRIFFCQSQSWVVERQKERNINEKTPETTINLRFFFTPPSSTVLIFIAFVYLCQNGGLFFFCIIFIAFFIDTMRNVLLKGQTLGLFHHIFVSGDENWKWKKKIHTHKHTLLMMHISNPVSLTIHSSTYSNQYASASGSAFFLFISFHYRLSLKEDICLLLPAFLWHLPHFLLLIIHIIFWIFIAPEGTNRIWQQCSSVVINT